jgi:hypothetical protein
MDSILSCTKVFFVLVCGTGRSQLMNENYAKGNYEKYQLVITVKKALFGSYVLEDWDLKKR